MGTAGRREIVKAIAEKTGQNASVVEATVQCFMDQVVRFLVAGDRLEFREFGVFELRRRKGRTARNPKTGDPIQVPPRTVVIFKPGKVMKEKVVDLIPQDK